MTSVQLTLPLATGVTAVTGSASASQGSASLVTDQGVTSLVADLGVVAAGASATAWVDVTLDVGLTGVFSHQATVTTAQTASELSDDPSLPGHHDPTATRVYGADSELSSVLGWRLLTDVDGNEVPSPGDTLRWEGAVANGGLATATSVTLSVPLDSGASVVAGTASASQGTVTSGALATDTSFDVNLGDLAGGESATFSVDVVVKFKAALTTTLTAQGTLNEDGVYATATDDPTTSAVADATVVPVSTTPYPDRTGYDGPWPEVALLTPVDGAREMAVAEVTATMAPTSGETLVYWRALLWPADGDEADARVLSEGETAPPAPPASLGTLDTTLLANGLWRVKVEAIDSAGLIGTDESVLEVNGLMKPGQLRLSYLDAEYPLPGGGSLQVMRVYDSLNRDRSGDFGHGWTLELVGPRVQTNGKLGDRGWGQESCGESGMFHTTLCWTTLRERLVAVSWPDGAQEVFTFTPAPVTTMLPFTVTPTFTARNGTVSSLAVSGPSVGFFNSEEGTLVSSGGVYDPQRYALTQLDGTTWVLDKTSGLVSMTDRFGEGFTVTPTGLDMTRGLDLGWERDGQGRITRVVLPDGADLHYTCDLAGDLVAVTDRLDNVADFAYASGHLLTSHTGPGSTPLGSWTYDADGRLTGEEDGTGVDRAARSFRGSTGVGVDQSWDPNTFEVTFTGPDPGLTTVEAYDSAGLLASVTQSWDEGGVPVSEVTSFTYDGQFRVVGTTFPNGTSESRAYDAEGRVVRQQMADGTVVEVTFDAQGNELSVRVDGEEVQASSYAPDGRLTSMTRDGVTATLSYDPAGLLSALTTPDGTVTFTYDAYGLASGATLPNGQTVSVTRDAYGRPTAVVTSGRGTVSMTYDAAGRPVTRTDENGSVPARGVAEQPGRG